jgi:hypothetical protein
MGRKWGLMDTISSPKHIHDDELTIYVRGGLDPEKISSLESHLSECAICKDTLATCVGIQFRLHYTGRGLGGQQRLEPRFETRDEAILQQLSPLSFERQRVKLINVSRNGIGLLAANPLFPGVIVQLRIGKSVELGEVRHCAGRGIEGYRIGLRLHLPL